MSWDGHLLRVSSNDGAPPIAGPVIGLCSLAAYAALLVYYFYAALFVAGLAIVVVIGTIIFAIVSFGFGAILFGLVGALLTFVVTVAVPWVGYSIYLLAAYLDLLLSLAILHSRHSVRIAFLAAGLASALMGFEVSAVVLFAMSAVPAMPAINWHEERWRRLGVAFVSEAERREARGRTEVDWGGIVGKRLNRTSLETPALHKLPLAEPSEEPPAPQLGSPPLGVEAVESEPSGDCDRRTLPDEWVAAGYGEQAWEQWRDDVDDASRVTRLINAGLSAHDLRAWRRGGFNNEAEIVRLHSEGMDPEGARAWRELGAERIEDILGWQARWDLKQANRWLDATRGTLDTAWRWAVAVDFPSHARRWTGLGFQDEATASRVIRAIGLDPKSGLQIVESLVQAGVGAPDPVLRWLESSTLEDVKRWVAAGVVDIDQSAAWVQAGFDLRSAERWTRVGATLGEAVGWLEAGFDPEAAQPWCEAGATPELARPWIDSDFESAEAVVWLTAGVQEPGRATELAGIGFSPLGYRDATARKNEEQIHQVVRVRAIRAAGLALEGDVPTVTFDESEDPEQAVLAIARISAAAAASGEEKLKAVHGSPHLSLAAIRALPDARYVRGRLKVRLLDALYSGELEALGARLASPESSFGPAAEHDGGSTVLLLRPADAPDEYLRLPSQGAVSR